MALLPGKSHDRTWHLQIVAPVLTRDITHRDRKVYFSREERTHFQYHCPWGSTKHPLLSVFPCLARVLPVGEVIYISGDTVLYCLNAVEETETSSYHPHLGKKKMSKHRYVLLPKICSLDGFLTKTPSVDPKSWFNGIFINVLDLQAYFSRTVTLQGFFSESQHLSTCRSSPWHQSFVTSYLPLQPLDHISAFLFFF